MCFHYDTVQLECGIWSLYDCWRTLSHRVWFLRWSGNCFLSLAQVKNLHAPSQPLRHLRSGVLSWLFSRESRSGGDLVTHPSQFWWEKHPPSVLLWIFSFLTPTHSRSQQSHSQRDYWRFSLQGSFASRCCAVTAERVWTIALQGMCLL